MNTASEAGYDPKSMPGGLSERDICTKFITPAVERAAWDVRVQVREEVALTAGRVIVRGQADGSRQDQESRLRFYFKFAPRLAVMEAKVPRHSIGDGMQQAMEYAQMLGVPFALSANGTASSCTTGQA